MKTLNKDNFSNEFNNQEWNEIIDSTRNDVDYSIGQYMSTINNILDSHMPLKKLSSKQFKQRFKPWIRNDILNKIREKKGLNKLNLHEEDNREKRERLLDLLADSFEKYINIEKII